MNNEEKIKYLNRMIRKEDCVEFKSPDSLFKYRPFDDYTFDMLENKYLYLCPAENEDDETECITSFDYEEIVDLDANAIKKEFVNVLLELIHPYTNEIQFNIARDSITKIVSEADGSNFYLDKAKILVELQKIAPQGVDATPMANWISNLTDIFNSPKMCERSKKLFDLSYNARKTTGICSLAESNDNDYMWKNYANNFKGYCVEYDMHGFNGILPVIYQDERETNIITQMVATMMGEVIYATSKHLIEGDASGFLRLFLTKYKKWEYQKEWRIIGDAGGRVKAPRIKAIYYKSNIDDSDLIKMKKYCNTNSIDLIRI